MGAVRIFKRWNSLLGVFALGLFLAGAVFLSTAHLYAQEKAGIGNSSSVGWGFMAAAISVGLSSIAAGIAVSGVGSAAMGAVSERPELMGRSLIYVGLAEGIAIYGLIISIMILARI